MTMKEKKEGRLENEPNREYIEKKQHRTNQGAQKWAQYTQHEGMT